MKRFFKFLLIFFVTFLFVYFIDIIFPSIKFYKTNHSTLAFKKNTFIPTDLTNTTSTISPTATSTILSTITPSPSVIPTQTLWKEPHEPIRASQKNTSDIYEIKVNIAEQRTYIYKNNTLLKKFICSSGLDASTPNGTYYINDSYGKSFFNPKYQSGAKYWVGFIDSIYLFHSVPIDENGNFIEEERKKLGSPASHGCIRLSDENAFWFYENIPSGSKVIIN